MKIKESTKCVLLVAALLSHSSRAESFEVELQKRDPITGEVQLSREKLEPAKVAVVVVDMWNWHWCKTSTARVAALVPRMIKVVNLARDMGMTIFWCPSDVADNYIGTVPYETAFNVQPFTMPAMPELNCPSAPDGGGCTCGKERCVMNYGWDGMHPDLHMSDADLMPNDLETLYTLCKQRGFTHVIYMGVHTQICLLGKSIGMRNMLRAGFKCILARDLTDAHGKYDPEAGITPDQFTSNVVAHFEKHLAPTINFAEELRKSSRWNSDWIVDPVRITPWGTRARPHLFEDDITVTLSAPWEPNASIYYTLDGTEPTTRSQRYIAPFKVARTTLLRTAAFQGEHSVCIPSEAYFAKLGAKPPEPDVRLGDLKPLRVAGPGHSPSSKDLRYSPVSNPPQRNQSNRGNSLRLRTVEYANGFGVHAPNQMVYALKPEFARFVALAGVDEHILETNNGSNLARYPSVVFKIIIDGASVAESPVMRISEQPWRFDVPIPQSARQISLVATDAGDGNREDLANWVNPGFVLRNKSVANTTLH